jgi:hypothetical protein
MLLFNTRQQVVPKIFDFGGFHRTPHDPRTSRAAEPTTEFGLYAVLDGKLVQLAGKLTREWP